MSYLENTPFSPITVDTETGKPLSPEAIENRERLILLWKIQREKQAAMEADLNDPATMTESALTGEEFISLLRNLMQWGQTTCVLPALKIDALRKFADIRYTDTLPGNNSLN